LRVHTTNDNTGQIQGEPCVYHSASAVTVSDVDNKSQPDIISNAICAR